MLNLLLTKIFIAVGTFFISFVSAAAPLKVIHIDDHIFSVGNMVASGILFSSGIVHQLPDSIESLEGCWGDFPLASFLAGLTFTLFLMLEEYLHTQFEDNPFERSDNHTTGNVLKRKPSIVQSTSAQHEEQHRPHTEWSNLVSYDSIATECSVFLTSNSSLCESGEDCRGRHNSNGGSGLEEPQDDLRSSRRSLVSIRRSRALESMKDFAFGYEHPVHYHEEHLADHAHGSLLSSIFLLGALSVHSFFEALAIGVATTESSITTTTSAVLAHKAFAGYALGSAMVASHMKKTHVVILSFVFGCCSIVGVFVGILLEKFYAKEEDDKASRILIGIIQAIVTGTFMYVSVVEIAMKELMTHRESETEVSIERWQLYKLVAFLVGYLVMSALALWV